MNHPNKPTGIALALAMASCATVPNPPPPETTPEYMCKQARLESALSASNMKCNPVSYWTAVWSNLAMKASCLGIGADDGKSLQQIADGHDADILLKKRRCAIQLETLEASVVEAEQRTCHETVENLLRELIQGTVPSICGLRPPQDYTYLRKVLELEELARKAEQCKTLIVPPREQLPLSVPEKRKLLQPLSVPEKCEDPELAPAQSTRVESSVRASVRPLIMVILDSIYERMRQINLQCAKQQEGENQLFADLMEKHRKAHREVLEVLEDSKKLFSEHLYFFLSSSSGAGNVIDYRDINNKELMDLTWKLSIILSNLTGDSPGSIQQAIGNATCTCERISKQDYRKHVIGKLAKLSDNIQQYLSKAAERHYISPYFTVAHSAKWQELRDNTYAALQRWRAEIAAIDR